MMRGWVGEVREAMAGDPAWAGWELKVWEYDMSAAVRISDVASLINAAIGPCVLLRNVQERVIVELRERLYGRAVVLVGNPSDSTDILGLLDEARVLHQGGEPMLPRKLVIALLLIAKLERHQMWGGKNKGYMWASDLPKGRGLDEQFADQVPAAIHDLFTHGLLMQKPSNGKSKYALNPDHRTAVHTALRTWRFPGGLHQILARDERLASARHLDPIYDPE